MVLREMISRKLTLIPTTSPAAFHSPKKSTATLLPQVAQKRWTLVCGSERVAAHRVPAAEPLDLAAQGEDQQEAVARADATVVVLNGDVPLGLPRQVLMGEAEAHRAAVAGPCMRDLGDCGV